MAAIPANLLLLHHGEETLWQRSLTQIQADPDLADHLDLTERVMDAIDVLRKSFTASDDERAISHLGLRTFNNFATAWKLAASGYYQPAVSLLRDIIETINLVSYFQIAPGELARWRAADARTLKNDFSPAPIRKALDDHAGRGKSKREAIYRKFSVLAGHPNMAGFAMLRPRGMDAQIGPFSDVTALRAVLEEMGMLAVQAGFAFCIHLNERDPLGSASVKRFLTGAMDYSGKFLGRVYSAAERAELERLFATP
ncbi:hypothetical protein [Thermomonas brevis]